MKISFGFSIAALAALAIFTGPASAGPFFRVLDNNGNTISQLVF